MRTNNSSLFKVTIRQAGFTLIELMIAMIISLVLVFACTTLYSSLKNSIAVAQDLGNAQESLRGAFHLMARSVRQAKTFTLVGASGAAATELRTIYGETPTGEMIYSCLGNPRSEDDEDVFFSDVEGLYCDDDGIGSGAPAQLIALNVEEINFENISGNNDDGLNVRIKIAGMPDTYSNGLSFKLALRQKILFELNE